MLLHFGKTKKNQPTPYDSKTWKPALRCSICTGEQTAGFRNLASGHFREECLIRTPEDLKEFMDKYGIREEDIEKFY